MTPSNRVIVNTGAQYIRTVINVLLALYATRLILKSLGADDYLSLIHISEPTRP
mgnify:CR=1 FL=1